jgi:outer membrane lipoprotein SlyB
MDPVIPQRQRLHPIVIAAAAAIIALSAVGIATLLYNRSAAQSAPTQAMASNAPANVANDGTVPPPPSGFDNTAPVSGNAPLAAGTVAQATAPIDATPAPPPPGAAPLAPPCPDCVTVVAERPVSVRGRGTGLGAVAGGIGGGLLGSTIGRGHGNIAMTVLGAAGGAYAGNAIEENAHNRTEYQMTVRYPDGRERTFTHAQPWGYQVGQTVRVVQGRVVALN